MGKYYGLYTQGYDKSKRRRAGFKRMRGMPEKQRQMGTPENLSDLWACGLLRSVKKQARNKAL